MRTDASLVITIIIIKNVLVTAEDATAVAAISGTSVALQQNKSASLHPLRITSALIPSPKYATIMGAATPQETKGIVEDPDEIGSAKEEEGAKLEQVLGTTIY